MEKHKQLVTHHPYLTDDRIPLDIRRYIFDIAIQDPAFFDVRGLTQLWLYSYLDMRKKDRDMIQRIMHLKQYRTLARVLADQLRYEEEIAKGGE